MTHALQDRISLELSREVASRLRVSSEPLATARENLDRWSRRNAESPSLLRCYEEWRSILERPVEGICAVLCDDTGEGQRLRQNFPFAGVLTPAEVWEIKSRLLNAATST